MTNDNTRHRDRLDSKLDTLLPSPGKERGEHEDVRDQMDNVLTSPHRPGHHADDASTQEELEVDTSNDGEDDLIRLRDSEN